MPKVKVKAVFAIGDLLTPSGFFNRQFKRELGDKTIREMKRMIRKGNSPVKGERRFKGYAAQRREAKSDYPRGNKFKKLGKRVRPVNLKLTGDMLSDLKWKSSRLGKMKIGVLGDRFSELKARVHNEGERRDIPQRKFIPFEKGDQFAQTIQKKIKDIHEKRLNAIIKKSNKK